MARAENTEFIDLFEEFYQDYYRKEIGELAQKYPTEQKSLFIDWQDLYRFDPDLAEDYRNKPEQLQEYAEEALRLFDLPIDVKLGQAHVRIKNLPESTDIRKIRANHRGQLISIQGIVRKATEVRSKITDAAFECQRCGTLTRIPQSVGDFQEPHECQGCERQGPFRINHDQSEFIDAQTLHVIEDPTGLADGVMAQEIAVNTEDDLAGKVSAGDRVTVAGVVKLDQDTDEPNSDTFFTSHLNAHSIESDERTQLDDTREESTLIEDLDVYTNLAATALSTLPDDVREEETKAKLITPLIEALGWNKYDSTEVRLEYTDPKTQSRPDYALFGPDSEVPDVIIEAKQLGTNLEANEGQLYDFLRVFSAELGMLTNGEEFYVYQYSNENYLPEKLTEMNVGDLSDANLMDPFRRSRFYD